MDAHGFYSYHFSSTVDDIEDGINLIVEEMISSIQQELKST